MSAPVRCAVYTRKSSDEGLEQRFNSLEAQREACEAYVQSQVGEGWVLLPRRYDDGGYSGGGMDRPALSQLLDDVRAKRVDAVIVYKVDRLTRSLADFARIIEVLEMQGTSFVSITQAFNTISSMGRLTLNVLLSFAQFEREITGERIRDKIAASKAKGMWMGGLIPLGYDAPISDDHALVVNPEEAKIVRLIFAWYLQLGGLFALQKKLDEDGVRSKRQISTRGRPMGGSRFSRGALRYLLGNRIYLGEIVHKGVAHVGLHQAIVDRAVFEAAQALLSAKSDQRRRHVSRSQRMLLNGRLFDADGLPMDPRVAQGRRRKHYFYYASRPAPRGALGDDQDDAIRSVSAAAIDGLVTEWARKLIAQDEGDLEPNEIRKLIWRVEVQSTSVCLVIRIAALPCKPSLQTAMANIRRRLSPGERALPDPAHAGLVRILLPTRLVVRGGRSWLTESNGRPAPVPMQPNPALVRQLRSGHSVLRRCAIHPGTESPRDARAPKSAKDRKFAQMAFLAPDLQEAILSGQITNVAVNQIPLSWTAQRRLLTDSSAA